MDISRKYGGPEIPDAPAASCHIRRRLHVNGVVQGVGFRPFVWRLARTYQLSGHVANAPSGAVIEIQGAAGALEQFQEHLLSQAPPHCRIDACLTEGIALARAHGFTIEHSRLQGSATAGVLPDLAVCPECLAELFDPSNRRFHYPFINCTHCGPRFSILECLPYDRPNTTMKRFRMCAACRDEYENPEDRRFHAQPIACPDCGPQLALWNAEGAHLASRGDAWLEAAERIRSGQIAAIKGLGGFQLLCDARNEGAVALLRQRKHRDAKPFAIMAPSLESVASFAEVEEACREVLAGPEAPIVLLPRRDSESLAENVAPGSPCIGVMLPYTPLHHLLMRELGFPIVATSGNISDEPMCTCEQTALEKLGAIADVFLVHDRPIQRTVDDSIVRVMNGRPVLMRRARGYAPEALHFPAARRAAMAMGAHLKNTIALARPGEIILGQHIGDLDSVAARTAHNAAQHDLSTLFGVAPEVAACDLHPDYASTRAAHASGLSLAGVQHHYAHVLACMAEHQLDGPVLGVSWDGTGYGPDGTIWGGEFLRCTWDGFERAGCLKPFMLPGGEKAIREPWRILIAMLAQCGWTWDDMRGQPAFSQVDPAKAARVVEMAQRGIGSPITTSAGRLFDACAAALGLCRSAQFEGQAAMALEAAACTASGPAENSADYEIFFLPENGVEVLDWRQMIASVMRETAGGGDVKRIARAVHRALAQAIAQCCMQLGDGLVVLTGGCFQNRLLTEFAVAELLSVGKEAVTHERIPPNDGGIALGQAAWASRQQATEA